MSTLRKTLRYGTRTGCAGLCVAFAMVFGTGCSTGPVVETETLPTEFVFWPPFPDEPRIQFLRSYALSSDVEPVRQSSGLEAMVFGEDAVSALPIIKPYGLDMWDAKIYVCDTKSNAVIVLDLAEKQVRLMGVTGADALTQPTDIAISEDGIKYVSDKVNQLVLAYDKEERFAAKFAVPGFQPVGLAVHGDELFVCDAVSRQVLVLDRFTGEERRRIGNLTPDGEGGDGLMFPLGIEVDEAGNVTVSDVIGSTVKRFTPEGDVDITYGTLGDMTGDFRRPKQVAVDSGGFLYVVDAAFQNVQVFSADEGQILTYFGGSSGLPGSMYLPAGVTAEEFDDATREIFAPYIHPAFNAERLILVTNQFGPYKVAVYAMGALKEGKTLEDIAPTRIEVPTGLSPNLPDDQPIRGPDPAAPDGVTPVGDPDGGNPDGDKGRL